LPDGNVEIGFGHYGSLLPRHAMPRGAGASVRRVGRIDVIVSPQRHHFKRRFSQSDGTSPERNPITID
jgi:hypothetical protein